MFVTRTKTLSFCNATHISFLRGRFSFLVPLPQHINTLKGELSVGAVALWVTACTGFIYALLSISLRDRQTDRQTETETDRQTDRDQETENDGQTDRETDG